MAVIIGVALFAVAPYLALDPAQSRVKLDPTFSLHFPLLVVHIFTALVALLVGPFQFSEALRQARLRLHRALGRIYLFAVLISGGTGLIIAFFDDSFTKQMAFITLSILWLYTARKGYRTIRHEDVAGHRVWMFRNYGMTLVAVTARLIMPICIVLYFASHGLPGASGVPQVVDAVLQVNIWIGIVLNLVIVDWSMLRK